MTYELQQLGGRASTEHFKPKLNLKIRQATEQDKIFMKKLQSIKTKKKRKVTGVYADVSFIAPKPERVNRLRKEKRVVL